MIFELVVVAAAGYAVAKASNKRRSIAQLLAQENKAVLNGPVSWRKTTTETLPQQALKSLLSLLSMHPISRLLKVSNTKQRHLIVGVIASVASALLSLLPFLLFGLLVRTVTLGRSLTLVQLGIVGLRS